MDSLLNYENGLLKLYFSIWMNLKCDLSYKNSFELRKWIIELLDFGITEIDGFENVELFYLNI